VKIYRISVVLFFPVLSCFDYVRAVTFLDTGASACEGLLALLVSIILS
jgi:hypothetical protein